MWSSAVSRPYSRLENAGDVTQGDAVVKRSSHVEQTGSVTDTPDRPEKASATIAKYYDRYLTGRLANPIPWLSYDAGSQIP
jgi:hypothetical protein